MEVKKDIKTPVKKSLIPKVKDVEVVDSDKISIVDMASFKSFKAVIQLLETEGLTLAIEHKIVVVPINKPI